MALHQDPRDAWVATGKAINAGATSVSASQASATNIQYAITDVSGSCDIAGGDLQVLDGTTVIWQMRLNAGVPFAADFSEPLLATSGNSVTAKVTSGSLAAYANVNGYRIANG